MHHTTSKYLKPENDPHRVEFYEGLVGKTATMFAPIAGEEYDDVRQMLWLKVHLAIESFDPKKARQPIEKYVFSCVRNRVKDLLKRNRRDDLYIEDVAPVRGLGSSGDDDPRDKFEQRYLSQNEEEAYAELLKDTPLIPSTLSGNENRVLVFLYLDYKTRDIANELQISTRDVAKVIRSIKEKMADWKPTDNGHASNGNGTTTLHGRRTVEREQSRDQESIPEPR